jgi:hypothetical protein
MPKRNHRSSSDPTPFLAQLLFQPTRDQAPPCQGTAHQDQPGPPQAGWEVRCYQDMDRLLALLQQGVAEAQATELLWQQACQEQDRRGVRLHRRVFLCQDCPAGTIGGHAGQGPATLAMLTAQVSGQALLLVTDRRTEQAAILGPLPGGIQERDLVPLLRRRDALSIHLKQ